MDTVFGVYHNGSGGYSVISNDRFFIMSSCKQACLEILVYFIGMLFLSYLITEIILYSLDTAATSIVLVRPEPPFWVCDYFRDCSEHDPRQQYKCAGRWWYVDCNTLIIKKQLK